MIQTQVKKRVREKPPKGLDLKQSHGYTQQTELSFHLVPRSLFPCS